MLPKVCPVWLHPRGAVESDILRLVFVVESKTLTQLLIENSSRSGLLLDQRSVRIFIEFSKLSVMQGRSAFAASDEESGECRTHTFPQKLSLPPGSRAMLCCFWTTGKSKGMRQPSGITPASSLPWVSAELLLFTTRYAVIRLRSRECVASLPPVPMQHHLRSGAASVAWLPSNN